MPKTAFWCHFNKYVSGNNYFLSNDYGLPSDFSMSIDTNETALCLNGHTLAMPDLAVVTIRPSAWRAARCAFATTARSTPEKIVGWRGTDNYGGKYGGGVDAENGTFELYGVSQKRQ